MPSFWMSRWKPSVPYGNSSTEQIGSKLGLHVLCISGTTCRLAPWQSTARGWTKMDRAARLVQYQDREPSFVDGKLYQLRCSLLRWQFASSSTLHDRLRQQTWLQLLIYGTVENVLTNQLADKRAQGWVTWVPYARFALISVHIFDSCLSSIHITAEVLYAYRISDDSVRDVILSLSPRPVICQPVHWQDASPWLVPPTPELFYGIDGNSDKGRWSTSGKGWPTCAKGYNLGFFSGF